MRNYYFPKSVRDYTNFYQTQMGHRSKVYKPRIYKGCIPGEPRSVNGRWVISLRKPNGTYKTMMNARYILERKLGRYLLKGEQAHHIDGNPLNDAPDNLEVLDKSKHAIRHAVKRLTTAIETRAE